VARLVLQAGVPVIPVAMINTQIVPSAIPKIPTMRRPVIRIGRELDFTAYAAAGRDREVLRWVTDRIMDEVMTLSGQEYVDAYGATVKAALAEGEQAPPSSTERPGAGQRVPPVPAAQP
jgi:1-acyl-sn-glycerol-3-phosphate acyltransferase